MSKLKVLFSSNAPWNPTGYGQQAKRLIPFLKKEYELTFLANTLSYGPIDYDGVTCLADPYQNLTNECIIDYVDIYKPDKIFCLLNWYAYDLDIWNSLGVPWFIWSPIDGRYTHNFHFVDKFKSFVSQTQFVTMSQYGTDEIRRLGLEPRAQIGHIIDTDVFKPLDKTEARSKTFPFNFHEYDLTIGMVMGNYEHKRKAFDSQFNAIIRFAQRNLDLKILLYVHADNSSRAGGQDLNELIKDTRLADYVDIVFTPRKNIYLLPYTDKEMGQLYNCFDIVMNASLAEGFGVPIVEAQACGVPVLTHKNSASSENTFYGYSAESDGLAQFNSDCRGCVIEQAKMIWYQPSIDDMANGLQNIFETKNDIDSLRAHEWVKENFNGAKIFNAWKELLG